LHASPLDARMAERADAADSEELYPEPEEDIAHGFSQPTVYASDNGDRQISMTRRGFPLPDRLLCSAHCEGSRAPHSGRTGSCAAAASSPATPSSGGSAHPKARKRQSTRSPFLAGSPSGRLAPGKPWKNPKADQGEHTFAILTGEPNELPQPIHDRMTTILEPRDYAEYLAPSDRPPLTFSASCRWSRCAQPAPKSPMRLLNRGCCDGRQSPSFRRAPTPSAMEPQDQRKTSLPMKHPDQASAVC
jgi:hypothetical protein